MLTDASHGAPSQLPLNVDGLPLLGAPESHYAIRAAIESLPDELRPAVSQLRRQRIAVLSDFFDPVTAILDAFGVRWSRTAGEDLPITGATIAVAGCPHRHTRLDCDDLTDFFSRGGVLISSDRAALMAGPARYLPAGGGRPPGRARIQLSPQLRDERLPEHVLPAVWLDPGHQILAEPLPEAADVLARDALSGAPLVVVREVSNGAMLHSVPHWMQDSPTASATGFEAYQLTDVPSFEAVGNSYPQVSLGAFLSASVMLRLLLEGLRRTPWAGGLQASAIDHEEGA